MYYVFPFIITSYDALYVYICTIHDIMKYKPFFSSYYALYIYIYIEEMKSSLPPMEIMKNNFLSSIMPLPDEKEIKL